jgi:hypothetical protein
VGCSPPAILSVISGISSTAIDHHAALLLKLNQKMWGHVFTYAIRAKAIPGQLIEGEP